MHSKGLWRPDSEEFSAHPEPSRTPAAHARGRPASSRLLCELLDRILAGVQNGPIFALAHEHDPDPAMRPYPEPMSAERRGQFIASAAAAVVGIYRYFEPRRRVLAETRSEHAMRRRTGLKLGRNDPCSCGSGKKYKTCCGKPTLH